MIEKYLFIPKDFNFETSIPQDIISIEFDSYFDYPIPNNYLPNGLKHINFGWYFNKDINDKNIPDSVETIKLGLYFRKSMDKLTIRNLKKIDVHDNYSEIVPLELLSIMPNYYQNNFEKYKKLQPEFYEKCINLDNNLFLPLNFFEDEDE
jgi:hypothetical protein